MNRRAFITLLGGAAAFPFAARAQQPALPVIGVLSPTSDNNADRLRAFRAGLAEHGYVEGQNVAIDFRSAEGRLDRLPAMAADFVRRQVTVIAVPGSAAAPLEAKAATTTIPIAFGVPEDPVKLGLVASLPRPGGNVTGINFFVAEVDAKRLGLLHELVPFERRSAENRLERLPDLAAELVRLNVDVIVALGTLAPLAAKGATTVIPIVMANAGDPLGSGLVASLARPGGNVTGMSLMAPDLGGKRLEMLKEVLPGLSRVAVHWNAVNPYSALVFKETQAAGQALDIQVQSAELRGPDDFGGIFEALTAQHPDALITVEDPLTVSNRKLIADFAAGSRLPALYGLREFVAAGGLMSYGASLADLYRRTAVYVDKIFKGAKPADLPVQQPTTFELVINLKTAKALGLDVPPALLARADEVIE